MQCNFRNGIGGSAINRFLYGVMNHFFSPPGVNTLHFLNAENGFLYTVKCYLLFKAFKESISLFYHSLLQLTRTTKQIY